MFDVIGSSGTDSSYDSEYFEEGGSGKGRAGQSSPDRVVRGGGGSITPKHRPRSGQLAAGLQKRRRGQHPDRTGARRRGSQCKAKTPSEGSQKGGSTRLCTTETVARLTFTRRAVQINLDLCNGKPGSAETAENHLLRQHWRLGVRTRAGATAQHRCTGLNQPRQTNAGGWQTNEAGSGCGGRGR